MYAGHLFKVKGGRKIFSTAILLCSLVLSGCRSGKVSPQPDLYQGFLDPPAESRPFLRWWWNGNRVEADEISREIALLKEAGFGGVEINPIAFPEEATDTVTGAKIWMSDEWIDLLVHACRDAHENGMYADLIVGSGWPFGGEFLRKSEILQRVVPHHILIRGSGQLEVSTNDLINKLIQESGEGTGHVHFNPKYPPQVLYTSLAELPLLEIGQGRDLMPDLAAENLYLPLDPRSTYLLSYGLIQRGHREVMHGAPGAAGPVMNHYKKEVTFAYLSRLNRIAEESGIPLSELIRALFCDSIEMAGSNWTDGLDSLFYRRYGYDITPYLSFVFDGEEDMPVRDGISPEQTDSIQRARYDYNRLLVDVFLENFTRVFQDFCTGHGLLCRYQAYGIPFLMGMEEGYLIPDIPESNNWIYSADMDSPSWQWNQDHGYMIWNLYAAAGGHLAGRRIISCEAMTNTWGVFKTSLEEIKQHDDMNFITGINHSVLHGFNYSPPGAGFPGWIRYGTYFSEQNPWWPYLHKWVEYNARLSYVFQNSQARKSIAILGPTADLWSRIGLERKPFHTTPWYLYRLWQPVSQAGYSCEYLNQRVLMDAVISDGTIRYGPMEYRVLVLTDIESLHPEVAEKIRRFVGSGGKLVIVDRLPDRSLHMKDAENNDRQVVSIFRELAADTSGRVIRVRSPEQEGELHDWTYQLMDRLDIVPDVEIDGIDPDVYQVHQSARDMEIYFFTNVHRNEEASFTAKFPGIEGWPYHWDPETGEREPCNYDAEKKQMKVRLSPLESMLLVFEKDRPEELPAPEMERPETVAELYPVWELKGKRVDGKEFLWEPDSLFDLSLSDDPDQRSFAGTLLYRASFENPGGISRIHLSETYRGVTELYLNGQYAGTNWYGEALFNVEPFLREGVNKLEIRYTTVLANYCLDLDDPVARRWTTYSDKVPTGIKGPVRLMR